MTDDESGESVEMQTTQWAGRSETVAVLDVENASRVTHRPTATGHLFSPARAILLVAGRQRTAQREDAQAETLSAARGHVQPAAARARVPAADVTSGRN